MDFCVRLVFFSNDIPWQYIAIRIVIRLPSIAIYRNTLLPYRDTPTKSCGGIKKLVFLFF
jgi:hypothetical protein